MYFLVTFASSLKFGIMTYKLNTNLCTGNFTLKSTIKTNILVHLLCIKAEVQDISEK